MRPSTIRNILFFVGLCVLAQVAWGHGGVSSTGERCMLYVYKPGTPVGQITQSQLKANFTGYQPERRASQNFCDDVPYLGKALFVIDFLSPELREMSVDFRILEDRNNAQWDTTYESLPSPFGAYSVPLVARATVMLLGSRDKEGTKR